MRDDVTPDRCKSKNRIQEVLLSNTAQYYPSSIYRNKGVEIFPGRGGNEKKRPKYNKKRPKNSKKKDQK